MSTIVTTPVPAAIEILLDGLEDVEMITFVKHHVAELNAVTPPQSRHALQVETLRRPEVTVWSMRSGDHVVGCGALRMVGERHAEIKSMRVVHGCQRRGLASRLLHHLIVEAQRAGIERLSLETGSFAYYAPARALYLKHGFVLCPPFGEYVEDPNSVFMTLLLEPDR
jgi:putative acetyltransferase